MATCTMGMGAYDEKEHERRAQKTGAVRADGRADRVGFTGSVEYDDGDSAEALLEQFEELKDD